MTTSGNIPRPFTVDLAQPLRRDGTSQRQRMLPALNPAYVGIDERSFEDLVEFAWQFSHHLNYFDTSNVHKGNWREFLEKDPTLLMARLAKMDLQDYSDQLAELQEKLENALTQDDETVNQILVDFIDFLIGFQSGPGLTPLFRQLEIWVQDLPASVSLQTEVISRIQGGLNTLLHQFYKEHQEVIEHRHPIGFPPITQFQREYMDFSPVWETDHFTYTVPPPFYGLVEGLGVTYPTGVRNSAKLFGEIAEQLITHLHQLSANVQQYLTESLESVRDHGPSMTLFIAFLQLFKQVQNQGNTLTRRHLDHYYQVILGMERTAAQPDQVHAILELPRIVAQHKIEAGTLLQAGKDATGKPVLFQTDREVVINRAKVAEIKTVHTEQEWINNTNDVFQTLHINQVNAAPIANSADGQGAPLPENAASWPAFGSPETSAAADNLATDTPLGFALASPLLLLNEGKRKIFLEIQLKENNALSQKTDAEIRQIEALLVTGLRIEFSGEKAWIEQTAKYIQYDKTSRKLTFFIELNGEQAAITPWSKDLPGKNFQTTHPVVCIKALNTGKWLGPPLDVIYDTNQVQQGTNYYTSNGNFHKITIGGPNGANFTALDGFEGYIEDRYSLFQFNDYYSRGDLVQSNGELYQALEDSDAPAPRSHQDEGFWKSIGPAYDPATNPPAFDPSSSAYRVGDLVTYQSHIYEAQQNASPEPERSPEFWELQDFNMNPYRALRELPVEQVNLRVEVTGVKDLILQNDLGVLDGDGPFQPFGPVPANGARFYIGSHEAFQKKLDALSLKWQWRELPKVPFSEYYQQYDPAALSIAPADQSEYTNLQLNIGNASFQADVKVLDQGNWQSTGGAKVNLFGQGNNAPNSTQAPNLGAMPLDRALHLPPLESYSTESTRGFLRLELSPVEPVTPVSGGGTDPGSDFAFGHSKYQLLYTAAIMNQAILGLPKAPYTPKMSSLELSYTSSIEIDFSYRPSAAVFEQRVEQFFHLHPFGLSEVHPFVLDRNESVMLLPQYADEGTLFIGLEEIGPGERVSLLFQLAEGSGDPDLPIPAISWSVLAADRWESLDSTYLITDTTRGLLRSGIMVFELPAITTSDNGILPSGKVWLRATVANHAAALNRMVEIKAQAVSATFQNNDNDPERLRLPMPAGSLTRLRFSDPKIAKVSQPYAAFGGRMPEQTAAYYTRVHERLRHKSRGITLWDYERMVLQEFPGLYKVKCLNHTRFGTAANPEGLCEAAPGHLLLITVPNVRNQHHLDPLQPRTSQEQLTEVAAFMRESISVFTQLEVRNPLYETVRVRLDVAFREEFDPGFYARQLNEDLKRFLSPWAFEEGEDILFGGRMHRSHILNFVEELNYVDIVNNFRMDHLIGETEIGLDLELIEATSPRSILISAATHYIRPLKADAIECVGDAHYSGISHWVVLGDFIVGAP